VPRRDLRNSVVVVTGATSGIGRMAAMMFGAKGARLVLAARRRDVLAEAAAAAGGRAGTPALAVPTDVAAPDEVDRLAAAAVDAHGRIDVWVNAAAVSAYGRFDEIPAADFRQVVETDLFGCVHGCRAALPVMRSQGRGTIVNIASMLSRLPAPYLTPHVVSKHGIRALSGCLRAELLDEPEIHVCTVHPGTIGTPLFGHVANYTGREVRAMPPVLAVERAARAVVRLAEQPRRDAAVGLVARLTLLQGALLPGVTERMLARYAHRRHFAGHPAEPTRGNLYDALGPEPSDGAPDPPRPGDTAEPPPAGDAGTGGRGREAAAGARAPGAPARPPASA
jgi:NAD(P)-dependent dehydrogenase (short-subunit alcohol dehydrogenase family)